MFGDWGQANSGSANPDQEALLARLAKTDARFAVGTGDVANPSGSQSNYGDLYRIGSSVSGVFGPRFWAGPGKSLPYFPAVGNHTPNSTFLVNWPQPRAVATSKGRYQLDTQCCLNGTRSKDYASAWYAFDAGGARFYVLQTAWDAGNVGEATQYKNDYDTHWTPTSAEPSGSRPTWPPTPRHRSSSPSSTTRCTPTRAAGPPTPSSRAPAASRGC